MAVKVSYANTVGVELTPSGSRAFETFSKRARGELARLSSQLTSSLSSYVSRVRQRRQ